MVHKIFVTSLAVVVLVLAHATPLLAYSFSVDTLPSTYGTSNYSNPPSYGDPYYYNHNYNYGASPYSSSVPGGSNIMRSTTRHTYYQRRTVRPTQTPYYPTYQSYQWNVRPTSVYNTPPAITYPTYQTRSVVDGLPGFVCHYRGSDGACMNYTYDNPRAGGTGYTNTRVYRGYRGGNSYYRYTDYDDDDAYYYYDDDDDSNDDDDSSDDDDTGSSDDDDN